MRLTRRRDRLLAFGVVMVLLVAFVGPYAERACREPVDISGTTELPGWLTTLKQRDELAYPAHVAVGATLNRLPCAPEAAGLQWVKAGAHARSDRDVVVAADGLAASRGRGAHARLFDATLCAYVAGGYARPQQEAVVARAGLGCPAPREQG